MAIERSELRENAKWDKRHTYIENVSFHMGFSDALIVLVLCLWLLLSLLGINFILTYGSDKPFGSIGIRFFASYTWEKKIRWKKVFRSEPTIWLFYSLWATILVWSWMLMLSLMRPRLSVWSTPHKPGTTLAHFLCTFISQASNNNQVSRVCDMAVFGELTADLPKHCKPWWYRPYSNEPQWSQNVGDV